MSDESTSVTSVVKIKKADAMKQIVYGEVYAPNEIDSHGDMMVAEDIEKMAHRFLTVPLFQSIDMNHDGVAVKAHPVESYIVTDENNPDYSIGSWVMAVKIEDEAVWEKVLSGEINGFSLEAMVRKKSVFVEVEEIGDDYLYTEKHDDHDHAIYVELDEMGKVVKGYTSVDNGHFHTITKTSATDDAEGHSHRFFLT